MPRAPRSTSRIAKATKSVRGGSTSKTRAKQSKVTAKKTKKVPASRLVATPKKSTTTTKKPSKKPSLQRTKKATPLTKQAASKSSAKPKQTKKSPPRTTNSDQVAAVVLPTRMSIRAREKALALAKHFESDFYTIAQSAARAGGISFLFIGALVTFLQLSPLSNSNVCLGACAAQQAAIITAPGTLAAASNYVELFSTIPAELQDIQEITFEVTNPQSVTVYLQYREGLLRKTKSVSLQPLSNSKYRAALDPTGLPTNEYEVKADIKHAGVQLPATYVFGEFAVSASEPPAEPEPEILVDPALEETSEPPVEPEPDPVQQVVTTEQTSTSSSSGSTNTEGSAVGQTAPTEQSQTTENENETVAPKEIADPVTAIETKQTTQNEVQENPKSLKISSRSIVQNQATLLITGAESFGKITVFARSVQGLNSQELGTIRSRAVSFTYDSRDLPNNTYEIYLIGVSGEKMVQSNTVLVTIANQVTTVPGASKLGVSERPTFTPSTELQLPTRPAVTPSTTPIPNRSASTTSATSRTLDQSATTSIKTRITQKLVANAQDLDAVFQAYASAKQTGDEILVSEAQQALDTFRTKLVTESLTSNTDAGQAREFDAELRKEFTSIQQRVDTFETVRRERTEADSAVDSDGDGISDIDETVLYKTNPRSADSDNDGFADGVEIINGFDPTDAKVEAAIVYKSPKETVGVIRSEKLKVTSVVPEIVVPSDVQEKQLRTVVTGTGLPNSFVTLYIFSTPTVVTVRTEADGSFAYTFSKELEDGEHQVFVALTDNTGDIVAQSEPFTFIKEAEAFTAVDAATTVAGTAAEDTAPTPYRVVLSMSVFALGILLIMLGLGLRTNRPESNEVEQPA